jgi:AcrR family transcriptional regulator
MRVDAARNRAAIIDAAREIFKERGLDAPLDDVAKRARVGSGTLYRHFPTRHDLHSAVVQYWIHAAPERAAAAVRREGSDRDRLRAWLEDYIALLLTHPGSAIVITCHLDDPESPFRDKCDAYIEAMHTVLAAVSPRPTARAQALDACRLVGGIAAVVDAGALTPSSIRALLELAVDGIYSDSGHTR